MRRWLICPAVAIMPSIGLGSTCHGSVAHGRLEQGVYPLMHQQSEEL